METRQWTIEQTTCQKRNKKGSQRISLNNKNENITYQNLWDPLKAAVLKGS